MSSTQFDHEQTSFLRFHVVATDQSLSVSDAESISRQASALVIVAVLNVDDERPRFEQTLYSLSVPENQPAMTLVG